MPNNDEVDPPRYHVCYMPWAGVEEAVTIGSVTFWPFRKLERSRIADADIRCFLGRYFDSYIDWMGDIEEGITIVTHTRDDFRELTESERSEITEAANWLCFSSVSRGLIESAAQYRHERGSRRTVPKGDHFQLHWKMFRPEDTFIGVSEEGVLAGFSLGRIRFPRPLHLPGDNFRYHPDHAILEPLRALLLRPDLLTLRRRINRALEWFIMSRSGGSIVRAMTRTNMLSTAFEIFLNFPSGAGQKRRYFADTMTALLAVPGLRTLKRRVGRPEVEIEYPLPGAWACDFYRLRSTITHGDEVTDDQWTFETLPSVGLGMVFFSLAVIQELWKANLIADDDAEYWAELARILEVPTLHGRPRSPFHPWIEDVSRGLGWLPPPDGDGDVDAHAEPEGDS